MRSRTLAYHLSEDAGRPQEKDADKDEESDDVLPLVAEAEPAGAHPVKYRVEDRIELLAADAFGQADEKPPAMAPGMLPMPPRTAAVKALMPGGIP
jgi:hypothetical protein